MCLVQKGEQTRGVEKGGDIANLFETEQKPIVEHVCEQENISNNSLTRERNKKKKSLLIQTEVLPSTPEHSFT